MLQRLLAAGETAHSPKALIRLITQCEESSEQRAEQYRFAA